MQDHLPALSGGLLPSTLDRRSSRAIARLDASTALAIRHDRARMQRIAETTQAGMLAVTELAGLESGLARMAPHAAGRIEAAAMAGSIQIVGVIHRAGSGF